MAPNRKRRSRRKWIVGVLLFVFVVMAGGSIYVYMRGKDRASLYDKAMQAWGNGNVVEAEEGFRSILASNSSHHQAREALIKVLIDPETHGTDENLAEAEALATYWTENERTEQFGWEYLIEIKLRRFRFTEAERIARSVSDQMPELALRTIIRVRDSLGSSRDRWEAQKVAASLAALTTSDANRAQMFLFAAETLADLKPKQKADEDPTIARIRASMDRQMRRYLTESRRSLEGALLTGLEDKTASNWAARMRLLSLEPREQAQGAAALRTMVAEEPDNHWSRAALIRYLVRTGQLDDTGSDEAGWGAIRHVRALDENGAPYPVWMRGVARIASEERRTEALELIKASGLEGIPLVDLRRAQILFEDDPDAGMAIVVDLARRKLDPSVLLAMYEWLADQEELRVYAAKLLRTLSTDGDVRMRAMLARSLVSGKEAERAEAAVLIEDLAANVESFADSLRIIDLLQRGGPQAVKDFVDPLVARGEGPKEKYMLIRAVASGELWRRAGEAEGSQWRDLAIADLEAFDTPESMKSDLVACWDLARTVEAYELAGRLLGRAIGAEGPPNELAYRCVQMAHATADLEVCAEVASGLKRAADAGSAPPLLEAVSDAIARKPIDFEALARRVDSVVEDEAVAVPALFLAVSLAERRGDRDSALGHAEKLYERVPESVEARDAWARQLLGADRFEDALELFDDEPTSSFEELRLRASALVGLRRTDEAIDLIRKHTRSAPRDPRSHLLLADLYAERGDRDEALGVLAAAPSSRDIEFRRGMLLLANEDLGLAEMVFLKMVDNRPSDLSAWRGLFTALRKRGKSHEFDEHISTVIPATLPAGPNPPFSVLLTMRAAARSDMSDFGAAISDYESAIKLNPEYVPALNNLAVLLAKQFPSQPAKVAEARQWVDRAREIAPDHSDILDTSAMVYGLLGSTDQALAFTDAALGSLRRSATAAEREVDKEKMVTYLLTRADVLERADRRDEAIEVLKEVLGSIGEDDPEQAKAVSRRLRALEDRLKGKGR